MIDNAGALGGAERFVTGLAVHLPRNRIEPWVCSTRHGEPQAIRALSEAGIPHINLGRNSTWQMHRLGRFAALLARQRIDVLHTHKFGSNLWGALIGSACRVPVILAHEHNWSYEGARLRVWLDGQVIGRLATRFIAVSEANRERMIRVERVAADKVLVMPTAYIPILGRPATSEPNWVCRRRSRWSASPPGYERRNGLTCCSMRSPSWWRASPSPTW